MKHINRKGGTKLTIDIKELTEKLLEPILEQMSLELFDIDYVKQGPDWILRIYIDKETGVTIDECALVSTKLSEKLDQVDHITNSYLLEVSSPGAERPLKTKEDFKKSINKHIYVSLYMHIGGDNRYTGTLKEFVDDMATIEYKDK